MRSFKNAKRMRRHGHEHEREPMRLKNLARREHRRRVFSWHFRMN